MPFIDFTTGQVLTADQMDLVMRQSVMRFADAATRDTALAEVLAEGMICYLDDTNEVLKYDGTDWVAIDPETITAQGDIIVGDAGGDASRLALGTAGQILESNGTALSYVTPDSSPDEIITTQGDLIIGDGSGDAVRLPVGAADTVLTSDGTTLSFEAAGGGGFAEYTLITSGTLSNQVLSITSIPQDYDDLLLRVDLDDDLIFRVNNISSSNYSRGFFSNETSNNSTQDRALAKISYGEVLFLGYTANINAPLFHSIISTGRSANEVCFNPIAITTESNTAITRIDATVSLSGTFKLYGVDYV